MRKDEERASFDLPSQAVGYAMMNAHANCQWWANDHRLEESACGPLRSVYTERTQQSWARAGKGRARIILNGMPKKD